MKREHCRSAGTMHRRHFVRIALGAGIAAGCTPVRIGLRMYPRDFQDNPDLVEDTLRAFVLTVVPGMPSNSPHLTQVFHDELFRLDAHRGWLAYDLCRRAGDETGDRHFAALDYARREAVIAGALRSGGVTERLYTAAIFVVQIAVYASIYDDDAGCPVWDYEGRFRVERLAGVTDPLLPEFRGLTASGSGNPA